MERIEISYNGNWEDCTDEKFITFSKRDTDDHGLHDYEICEMFLNFMRAVGFSEENIFKYFDI